MSSPHTVDDVLITGSGVLKSEIIPSPSLKFYFENKFQDISNFGRSVLDAQVELDDVLGHF